VVKKTAPRWGGREGKKGVARTCRPDNCPRKVGGHAGGKTFSESCATGGGEKNEKDKVERKSAYLSAYRQGGSRDRRARGHCQRGEKKEEPSLGTFT